MNALLGPRLASARSRRSARRCMSSASTRSRMADELGAYAAQHGLAIEPGRDQPRGRVHPLHGRVRQPGGGAHEARGGRHDPALLRPARRDARQGIRPDAARPHHLRDDARHPDHAAGPVRLRHQHRPQAARRRAARDRAGPLLARHRLGARGQQLLSLRRPAQDRRRGGGADPERRRRLPRHHPERFRRARRPRRQAARSSSKPTRPTPQPRAARSARSATSRAGRCCASRGASSRRRRRRTSSCRSSCTGATTRTAFRNISSCRACSASSCR